MKTIDAEDWHYEVANSIKNMQQLKEQIKLNKEEDITDVNLPVRITPYFLDVIKNNDILRRTVIPSINEFNISNEETEDPLSEDKYKKTDCLIHKYPDRVLFLCTNFCSNYCRYCTRSRVVGGEKNYTKKQWDEAIDYIKNHPEVRDVILSGGDPLTLSDDKLEYLLSEIRSIKHVEIIRIGTKIPVVMPSRITENLVDMLKKYHPLYMSIHFIHPSEITSECSKALNMIANAGIVMRSQTVLLKGINDDIEIMKELMHKLLINRVIPYYIYQCDLIKGTSHFRTSIGKGIEIIRGLRGHTSGYAIPTLIVDTNIGKMPINPDYIKSIEEDKIIFENYRGEITDYIL